MADVRDTELSADAEKLPKYYNYICVYVYQFENEEEEKEREFDKIFIV